MLGKLGKPVILISTGAWHPPECYAQLKLYLGAHGYEVIIPRHLSMGPKSQHVSWTADKDQLIEVAKSYFELGKEVVLVAHSYGGVPGGAATEGQGTTERQKLGLKGGFREIIFIAAFAIPVRGWDLITTFGGTWPDWQKTGPKYAGGHLSIPNKQALSLLYNDASAEEAQKTFDMLLPHSQDSFETGCDFIASDVKIKKTYIVCETDRIFPVDLQERLARSTPDMKEIRMEAGHSPFVGRAQETALRLVEIMDGSAQ